MSLRSSMEAVADCFDVYAMHRSSVFEVHRVRRSSSVQMGVFADSSLVSDKRGWRKLSNVGLLSNYTSLSVATALPHAAEDASSEVTVRREAKVFVLSICFSKEQIVFTPERLLICRGRIRAVRMIREFIEVEV